MSDVDYEDVARTGSIPWDVSGLLRAQAILHEIMADPMYRVNENGDLEVNLPDRPAGRYNLAMLFPEYRLADRLEQWYDVPTAYAHALRCLLISDFLRDHSDEIKRRGWSGFCADGRPGFSGELLEVLCTQTFVSITSHDGSSGPAFKPEAVFAETETVLKLTTQHKAV